MRQTRKGSFLEASLNTASGFILSYGAGFIIYPLLHLTISPGENLTIVLLYTLISIARSYIWRRIFNWYHHRAPA